MRAGGRGRIADNELAFGVAVGLADAPQVDAEAAVARHVDGDAALEVNARHHDGVRIGERGIALEADLRLVHLDGRLGQSPEDILDAGQGVDLAMAEVRGVGAVGVSVGDGRLLHDLLHVVDRQLLAHLLRSLQPQRNDAGSHGRGHRRALHRAVGIGRAAVDPIHVVVGRIAIDIAVFTRCIVVIHGRHDRGARGTDPRIGQPCGALVGRGIG